MESNLQKLVRRYGTVKMTIALTTIVTAVSAMITLTVTFFLRVGFSITALELAVITPIILVPLFEFRMFRVLYCLDQAEEKLKILSITDDLTGAYNRRYFFEIAGRELERARRYGNPFTIAILDFDNFKTINDTYGHLAGDLTLQEVGKTCRASIRTTDFFARYGGDEFVFLFPNASYDETSVSLDRLREKIATNPIGEFGLLPTKVSIGVASFTPAIISLDELLQQADVALYKAKKGGGDKVQ